MFTREASQGRLPKFVELLKFKNLAVGAKIWGCILSVTSKGLSLSLPDGLKGFVPIEEASFWPLNTSCNLTRQWQQVRKTINLRFVCFELKLWKIVPSHMTALVLTAQSSASLLADLKLHTIILWVNLRISRLLLYCRRQTSCMSSP